MEQKLFKTSKACCGNQARLIVETVTWRFKSVELKLWYTPNPQMVISKVDQEITTILLKMYRLNIVKFESL